MNDRGSEKILYEALIFSTTPFLLLL
jgi:hypothetical protein